MKRGTNASPAPLSEATNAMKAEPASAKKPVKAKTEGEKTLDGLYAVMTSLEVRLACRVQTAFGLS
jgi:hypothetical protein